jgi:hypothetical protein
VLPPSTEVEMHPFGTMELACTSDDPNIHFVFKSQPDPFSRIELGDTFENGTRGRYFRVHNMTLNDRGWVTCEGVEGPEEIVKDGCPLNVVFRHTWSYQVVRESSYTIVS